MVGRIMNRARNLWIMIISILIFLGIIALIWALTSQSKTEIPTDLCSEYRIIRKWMRKAA